MTPAYYQAAYESESPVAIVHPPTIRLFQAQGALYVQPEHAWIS
jgi:hypothetical protein